MSHPDAIIHELAERYREAGWSADWTQGDRTLYLRPFGIPRGWSMTHGIAP